MKVILVIYLVSYIFVELNDVIYCSFVFFLTRSARVK